MGWRSGHEIERIAHADQDLRMCDRVATLRGTSPSMALTLIDLSPLVDANAAPMPPTPPKEVASGSPLPPDPGDNVIQVRQNGAVRKIDTVAAAAGPVIADAAHW